MYFDGFLIPVRTSDQETYRAHEQHWWPRFREMGAQSLVVGWGDDVPAGQQTDFRRAVDLKDDETVVLCWMTWPDKAMRDAAYAKMMADPAMEGMEMPFDGKRMVWGGFTPILQLD
ncbi:DUF1428 domain-containing protein [Tabrizicola aquatica]|jgi:uncharacterized protein YbaA (DUF1428 family)|uniref:DUF1428 domain-containing protein n=1 Tax=Tabrizicola aquatica TaxID=909926 RepID=UPI000CD0218B|nr:DUF1428 domain-containing protein [Tabrizicola aquatica]